MNYKKSLKRIRCDQKLKYINKYYRNVFNIHNDFSEICSQNYKQKVYVRKILSYFEM